MNARQLAAAADKSINGGLRDYLSDDVCRKIGMAFIAQWLSDNDESCRVSAAHTACGAIEILKGMWRDDCGLATACADPSHCRRGIDG